MDGVEIRYKSRASEQETAVDDHECLYDDLYLSNNPSQCCLDDYKLVTGTDPMGTSPIDLRQTLTTQYPLEVIPASRMALSPTNAGHRADGGWMMTTNSSLSVTVDFPATGLYKFEIVAREDHAGEYPTAAMITVDGRPQSYLTIDSSYWNAYSSAGRSEQQFASFNVTKGKHRVAIYFTNDVYYHDSEDRNLYVQSLNVEKIGLKCGEDTVSEKTGKHPLRVLTRSDQYIGTALHHSAFERDSRVRETAKEQFNLIVPENSLKMRDVSLGPYNYDFAKVDKYINFAEENDMAMRGHTLVWHESIPLWLTRAVQDGSMTRQEIRDWYVRYIKTVVNRYKGKIEFWDVVNEAIAEDGDPRYTFWRNNIGPDYIELAFKAAHEADPEAKLFYNDFRIINLNERKVDGIYRLVKGLIDKGVPIHGIGFQGHLTVSEMPNAALLERTMQRFADLGLMIHVTELDVRIPRTPTATDLTLQAYVYETVTHACLNEPACNAITVWGFNDRYWWGTRSGTFSYGAATLYDRDFEEKKSYSAIQEELYNHLTGREETSY